MKNIIITILTVLVIALNLKAQTANKYFFTVNSSVAFDHYYKSFIIGVSGVDNFLFNVSIKSGKLINQNLYAGAGFRYNLSTKKYEQIEEIETNISGYSPIIFLQYRKNMNNLFNVSLETFTEYNFFIDKSKTYKPDPGYLFLGEYYESFAYHYINFGIRPAIQLKLKSNFGININFGILSYQVKTYDSRDVSEGEKNSHFNLSLKPETWALGVWWSI